MHGNAWIILPFWTKFDPRNDQGETALQLAIKCGSTEILDTLIQFTSDIDQVDFEGNTLMHVACKAGQDESLKLIYSCCQHQETALNEECETPFDVAVKHGRVKCVRYLLKASSRAVVQIKKLRYAIESMFDVELLSQELVKLI